MSAPVTEAHLRLANQLASSPPSPLVLATLIADSEALACAELRAELVATLSVCSTETYRAERAESELKASRYETVKAAQEGLRECIRAERAEAELANIRALADRRNKSDHSADTTHQLVAALDQALDIAQAELAAERARMADLVADLNDACITLASAAEDCDDYAMQNTEFKLTAVRDVLLQYIPNAAMKDRA